MPAAGKPPQRQAGWSASQDSIWPIHGGAPGIAAAWAPPVVRPMPPASGAGGTGRGRPPGQLQQRGGLQLADTLAADAEFSGQAVVGAPRRRKGAQGKDQPPPFLKPIEQLPGQPGQVAIG